MTFKFYSLIALYVVVASFLGLIALIVGQFYPLPVLGLSLLPVVALRRTFSKRISISQTSALLLSGVVMVMLVLIVPPYNFALGGQDQGVYVNMASFIREHHSLKINDKVRSSIDDPRLLQYYDTHAHINDKEHLPGIYRTKDKNSYLFQFYHLHSLWMSYFQVLFGIDAGVYSLTFFSVLAVLGMYLLVKELTERQDVSLLAAGLLGLNPLFVFFSKFPVSEILTLSLAVNGCYFYAWYLRQGNKRGLSYQLMIGIGLLACIFFTRITGLFFLPIFILLHLGVMSSDTQPKVKKAVFVATLGLLLAYTLSILYGLVYSETYSLDIYRAYFYSLAGNDWPWILVSLVGSGLGIVIASYLLSRRNSRLLAWTNHLSKYGYLFFYGVLALALYKAWMVGSGLVSADALSAQAQRSGSLGSFSTTLKSMQLTAAIMYLSPMVMIASLGAVWSMRKNRLMALLTWTAGLFAGVVFFVVFSAPYHYYYTRYLLPGVTVTFILIFSLLSAEAFEWTGIKRYGWWGLIVTVGIYYLVMVQFQVGRPVYRFESTHLPELAAQVDKYDLLVINKDSFDPYRQVVTSLTYYYGLSVISVAEVGDLSFVSPLFDRYEDIYVLSQLELPSSASNFTLEQMSKYLFEWRVFEHRKRVPSRVHITSTPLYLYSLEANYLISIAQ